MKELNIENNHLTTDDLAFSAYLRMKGYRLIKSNPTKSKRLFTFEIGDENPEALKMQFINSEFLVFYNEIRNLKKLI